MDMRDSGANVPDHGRRILWSTWDGEFVTLSGVCPESVRARTSSAPVERADGSSLPVRTFPRFLPWVRADIKSLNTIYYPSRLAAVALCPTPRPLSDGRLPQSGC